MFLAEVHAGGSGHAVHQLPHGQHHALAKGRHRQTSLQPLRPPQVHRLATHSAIHVASIGILVGKPLCNPCSLYRYTGRQTFLQPLRPLCRYIQVGNHSETHAASVGIQVGKPLCNPCGLYRYTG